MRQLTQTAISCALAGFIAGTLVGDLEYPWQHIATTIFILAYCALMFSRIAHDDPRQRRTRAD